MEYEEVSNRSIVCNISTNRDGYLCAVLVSQKRIKVYKEGLTMRIAGCIIGIILWAVIWFAIHPLLGFLMTVIPIAGVLYNWKDL